MSRAPVETTTYVVLRSPPKPILIAACLLWSVATLASARQSPATFGTPDEAIQGVVRAAAADDTSGLLQLFGPAGEDNVQSGDAAEDKAMREEFVRRAHEKVDIRIYPANPNKATVAIGSEAWPFPIPLIRVNGRWQFDIAQGRLTILAHRIGENELDTIEVCRGFVEAELEYASVAYAQNDELVNVLPKALVEAIVPAANGKAAAPYHGYYFRMLNSQGLHARGGAFEYVVDGKMIGGFALIAWTAEYGVSGIKTFIVNHDGVVYERDLGTNTVSIVNRIARFDPDDSWRQVVG